MVDIAALIQRAKQYAKSSNRSLGGVSKAIFDDVRTLALLEGGSTDITISRLERASQRLAGLEERSKSSAA